MTTMATHAAPPKLFVSYSWTSPDHEAWVVGLATTLRESAVDVILDKWDLKEGHDAIAFMEKMVSDPDIKKVILICDKAYVDKTDGRKGGVGTEAQIISGEIYAKQDQDKFVAIVKERDPQGKAYLPVYYKSRIYIDLSDQGTYTDSFERLLRWIFNQPLYKKPGLGPKPAFLSEGEEAPSLATSFLFKRAVDAARNSRAHSNAATVEYFSAFVAELEKFRLDPGTKEFDDAVVKSIDAFLPYRNEVLELFSTLALYQDSEGTRAAIHQFFERLIPYLDRPPHVTAWKETDFDNFRFVVHELFLYAVAILTKRERFESAAYLLQNEYFVAGRSDYGKESMVPYEIFRQPTQSIEYRSHRLTLNRLSLRADFLEQRCKGVGVEFRHIMQADFVLFLRLLLPREGSGIDWWPETLVFAGRSSGPFEVFARCKSSRYFERAKQLLGLDTKEALGSLLETFERNPAMLPRWGFDSFNPRFLLGFDLIETKP